jgi:hypothetical protein
MTETPQKLREQSTSDWLIVFDELDQLDTSARIFQLARSDRSAIVIYPGTDGGETGPASQILVALGKTTEGLSQNPTVLREAAKAWLRAELVEDIVIYGAQRLRGREEVFEGIDCRIWAVTPSRKYADELLKERGRSASLEDLFEELVANQVLAQPGVDKPFPRVPYDEFFTFLSSSRELHGPGPELDLIVKTFYEAYQGAKGLVLADEADPYKIKTHVHERMVRAPCVRSAVCRLRGIQASLFDRWCYLRVHLLRIWSIWNHDSQKGERGEIATACRQGIDSLPGVALSLAHLTELTARDACGSVTEYSDDGSSFTIHTQVVQVPTELQAFFRHQFRDGDPVALFRELSTKDHLVRHRLERILAKVEVNSIVRFSCPGELARSGPEFHRHLELHSLKRFPSPENALATV